MVLRCAFYIQVPLGPQTFHDVGLQACNTTLWLMPLLPEATERCTLSSACSATSSEMSPRRVQQDVTVVSRRGELRRIIKSTEQPNIYLHAAYFPEAYILYGTDI